MARKFRSMKAFREVAEFIPRGRIIPQRILKGPRKIKHHIVAGSDLYVLHTDLGYIIACDNGEDHTYALLIKGKNIHANVDSAPYSPTHKTYWIGNRSGAGTQLEMINKILAGNGSQIKDDGSLAK